jgi:hypothetical protein
MRVAPKDFRPLHLILYDAQITKIFSHLSFSLTIENPLFSSKHRLVYSLPLLEGSVVDF